MPQTPINHPYRSTDTLGPHNPGGYGAQPEYQRLIRPELTKVIEEERRHLDWEIPDRVTDKGLAARWAYLRTRRAHLEAHSHLGHARRQQAFHLLCLTILLYAGLRVTNAMIAYPTLGMTIALSMMGLSTLAFVQVMRPFLAGLSHYPGLGWLASRLDSRMADAPEVRIPVRHTRSIRWLRPVWRNRALPIRLPFMVRRTVTLPVRQIHLRLSALEHLQAREALRITDRED